MPAHIVNCPICQQPMQKRSVPPGLELDYCEHHGVWLDHGELEMLARGGGAPAGGGGGGAGAVVKSVGRELGRAAVFGAGATVGSRLVGGIIDSLFRR